MAASALPPDGHPYAAASWARLAALGRDIDARLHTDDVRLTMGGEPTFVAVSDPAAAEWNTAALGPTKRAYADAFARRLLSRFAPGGLLHYGEGKWYPGETAARWSFAVYWRTDGKPLWRHPDLIDSESASASRDAGDAQRLAQALCRALGLPEDSALPAFEDPAHYLLIEQKQPLGVHPGEGNFASAAERARIAKVFDAGLDRPAGYVLPLLMQDGTVRTERWAFQRDHLFLVPGDSRLGLRLPLGSLPEIAFIDFPDVLPKDPFAPRPPLAAPDSPVTPQPDMSGQPVRTALAVEVREGRLGVFLPPLSDGADYALLITAVERAAAETQLPIQLEGYAPPHDPRLRCIKVTPDPGVIEINVHPANSWDELCAITEGVYADAAAIGLRPDKFRLDGRRIPTGGGSHVVVGGIAPADSPFLRRPDLLASILAYWNNHPSLSYLFSGLFVGPTSQAPRVDEARYEALYELEIALDRLEDHEGSAPPWLVDRMFRNLLVDVTGNTHRAEICIDKLYAPHGVMGRLGLVEFRAFEMAPDAHMSLASSLLVRALIAWFWREPYRVPVERWGPRLHDAFMLPHAIWADFERVVADLASTGLPVEAEWFLPHLEFRCPVVGRVEGEGVDLILREALEPWLVLGEDSASPTAARIVDASLSRLEVVLTGPGADRVDVVCNGWRVPMQHGGIGARRFGAVRFRGWQPNEGFHPTIAPHAPLTFHVVPRDGARPLACCSYHAWAPPGVVYEALPADHVEAAARRDARFTELRPESPFSLQIAEPLIRPEAPMTLDLRRVHSRGSRE